MPIHLDNSILDLNTREAATMTLAAEVAAPALTPIVPQQIAETAKITEIGITLQRIVEATVSIAMTSLDMLYVVVAIEIAISPRPLAILAIVSRWR